MLLAKAKLLFLIAIWLSVLNLGCSESGEVSGDVMPSPVACLNCTICQYPCHTPAPPLPGYPSYGTPPPPPPLSDYPSYGALPPPPLPPPQLPIEGGCPPTPVVQCCQYPAPATYGYVPYNNYSASSPLPIFFFLSMISAFSFAALFWVCMVFPGLTIDENTLIFLIGNSF